MQNPILGISAYRSAMRTVAPAVAVVRLYDRAIMHMNNAANAGKCGDYEVQFNETSKAAQIFNGLNGILDMQRGGAVARSLRDMYNTINRAMFRAVAKPDTEEAFERLIDAVRETRDAWAYVAGEVRPARPSNGNVVVNMSNVTR